MNNVIDMELIKKRKAVAETVKNNDYSVYGFYNDYGKLKAEDSQVVLILLTVAKLIPCDTIKKQIKDAISGNYLKDWVLLDILVQCDETFFSKDIKSKTFRNIAIMEEQDLEDAFIEILHTINY